MSKHYPLGSKFKELPLQQQRFVEEYLIDNIGTKAAMRAGYSVATAKNAASRMLADPRVKAAIAEAQQARADRMGITQDRVLQELAKIAFSNLTDYISEDENGDVQIDIKNLEKDKAAGLLSEAILSKNKYGSSKTIKIKQADKVAAIIALGKHLGMFKEQVDHNVNMSLEQLVLESMKTEEKEDTKTDEQN